MIDQKEIRIGNWFTHNTELGSDMSSGPFRWDERHWYLFGDCLLFLDNVSPVELTPEVLEKAGFIYREEDEYHKKIDIFAYLVVTISDCSIALYDNDDDYNNGAYSAFSRAGIKLHNLQNIIHALIGQELQINL
jgi:hypothetical protein